MWSDCLFTCQQHSIKYSGDVVKTTNDDVLHRKTSWLLQETHAVCPSCELLTSTGFFFVPLLWKLSAKLNYISTHCLAREQWSAIIPLWIRIQKDKCRINSSLWCFRCVDDAQTDRHMRNREIRSLGMLSQRSRDSSMSYTPVALRSRAQLPWHRTHLSLP